jgi:hypothetical protein
LANAVSFFHALVLSGATCHEGTTGATLGFVFGAADVAARLLVDGATVFVAGAFFVTDLTEAFRAVFGAAMIRS